MYNQFYSVFLLQQLTHMIDTHQQRIFDVYMIHLMVLLVMAHLLALLHNSNQGNIRFPSYSYHSSCFRTDVDRKLQILALETKSKGLLEKTKKPPGNSFSYIQVITKKNKNQKYYSTMTPPPRRSFINVTSENTGDPAIDFPLFLIIHILKHDIAPAVFPGLLGMLSIHSIVL